MPQLVTHKTLVEGDKERAIFWATSFEKTCVKPLAEAGLLGGVPLQLFPYFKNEGSALNALNGGCCFLSGVQLCSRVQAHGLAGRDQEGDRCCNLGASERKECCQCPD